MAHLLIVTAFLLTIIVSLINSYKSKWKNRKLKNNSDKGWLTQIPGPKPFPLRFIGNGLQVAKLSQARRVFFGWCAKYPICFKFVAVNRNFVILNCPTAANNLLKSTDMGHIDKSFIYETMKPFMTSGLIVANGGFWQHHRKILNRSMNYHSLRGYMNMLNAHSRKLTSNLDKLFGDGQSHQINVLLNCCYLEIICEIISGSNALVEEDDIIQYHHNFQEWKASVVRRITKPWLLINFLWKLHPMSREYNANVEKLNAFAKRIIEKHAATFKDENNNDCNDNENQSMLSDLKRGNVPEEQILEEVNSLLLAGHETVATTMHFFCFYLASNPEIQELCQREIDTVFNDPMLATGDEENLTFEALSNLKYLERCIMETLRLFPPVYIYMRQLSSPLPIKINENLVQVPPGTSVVVIPSAIHMNPDYYPDPKTFNPDRFLPEEVTKRPLGSFIPFSGGPRGCLGVKFAMMELKVTAARVLRNFQLRTSDKLKDIPINPYVTLTPIRDYTFTFTRREQQEMN